MDSNHPDILIAFFAIGQSQEQFIYAVDHLFFTGDRYSVGIDGQFRGKIVCKHVCEYKTDRVSKSDTDCWNAIVIDAKS